MSSTLQRSDKTAVDPAIAGVEACLMRFIDRRPLPGNLREAIRYVLVGPGKRLRPMLVARSAQAVGAPGTPGSGESAESAGVSERAAVPAAAIELIHNFSLVHDDLPAMDDDDLRRGRPTLHKHTNEAMAILAGDAMLGLAVELVLTEIHPPALAAAIATELITANNDMIAGQVYDTLPDFDAATPPMQRLETIHKHKTGALIRCSCRMGAMVAGASPAALGAITEYAEAIGLMFQVVDDLLDVTQTTEHLGKAANKDAGKGKLTYPGLLGIEQSRAEVQRLQKQAHSALDRLESPKIGTPSRTQGLRELCDYMAVRSK